MSKEHKMIRLDTAQSTLRAVASKALAKVVVTGIDQCEQEGHPLTQLQQIDLVTMSVMAYDEVTEGESSLNISYVMEGGATSQ